MKKFLLISALTLFTFTVGSVFTPPSVEAAGAKKGKKKKGKKKGGKKGKKKSKKASADLSFVVADADKAAKRAAKRGLDMDATFKKIDGNSDSKLSKDEFAKIVDEVRAKGGKAEKFADGLKAKIDELFGQLDTDKNGSLNLEEAKKFDFRSAVGGKARTLIPDLEATFQKLDANNDKKLNKEEFAKVADEINPAKLAERLKGQLDTMFTKLDENKDDSLSADEFKKFSAKGAKRAK